jgi:AcrR family transcriptional regulator
MSRYVKGRRYNAAGRRLAARRTRERVLDEAQRLLLRRGYAATTIASVAKAADVSVETIYKQFGGKPGLVRAIRDRALAGKGPVHAEQRSDAMQAAASNPRRVMHAWSRLSAEVSPRVSPILLLVRDGAIHDRKMAALQRAMDADRLARMNKNAATLVRLGVTSSRARVRDILWLATSPEIYELLVVRRGWTIDDYAEWIDQMLAGTLLK